MEDKGGDYRAMLGCRKSVADDFMQEMNPGADAGGLLLSPKVFKRKLYFLGMGMGLTT